jgi:predicted ATPase
VLTGINSVGKTSLIHGLLLCRQASITPDAEVVELNGPDGLALGDASDVQNHRVGLPSIDLELNTDEGRAAHWRFSVNESRSFNLRVENRPCTCPAQLLQPGNRHFVYLTAERQGPRDSSQIYSADLPTLGVGHQGQYTAHVLAVLGREVVRDQRLATSREGQEPVHDLLHQAEAWMCDVARPIEIEANCLPNTSLAQMRFKTPGDIYSDFVRPPNIGFGVSYALPIVVAGLLTPPNGLLIVENPEAHLHPAGQSMVGDFLARVAADGVQVLVETHSYHVLNGIRLAVAGGRLPNDQVVIHHFRGTAISRGGDEHDDVLVKTIDISDSGALSSWPLGFFDQIGHDLGELASIKKDKSRNRKGGE